MPVDSRTPLLVRSTAPIRICDNGGWTDTWFAGHGEVFNIAVNPGVEVQVTVLPTVRTGRVEVYAENYEDTFDAVAGHWAKHPLIEATIERMKIPSTLSLRIGIYSPIPGGASTGTSSALTVALIAALNKISGRQELSPYEIAREAHAVETEMLGRQCGIQDQLCAAFGGINFIEMNCYPRAVVTQLSIPESVLWELEERLILIYLGKPHDSSEVHAIVIKSLEESGAMSRKLEDLRMTARLARESALSGDFIGLGVAMIKNTEAQGRLHHELISRDARKIIDIARTYGALGWKVNGAGGEGGSLTLLAPEDSAIKRKMIRSIESALPSARAIPISLNHHGVRAWTIEAPDALDVAV